MQQPDRPIKPGIEPLRDWSDPEPNPDVADPARKPERAASSLNLANSGRPLKENPFVEKPLK